MNREASKYIELSLSLNKKWDVCLSPQQLQGVKAVVAGYRPDERDKATHTAKYGNAWHYDIFSNVIDAVALFKEDQFKRKIPSVSLSRGEQMYISDMFEQRILTFFEAKRYKTYSKLRHEKEKFESRCVIARRQLDTPENVINIVPNTPISFASVLASRK